MPRKLLLADDSVTIQKVVAIVFAHEDFEVVTVANGEEAIARAREILPDIVLADVVMPGRDGYQVCEALKADPATRHIPVLLLAGTFEPFDEGRAAAAGSDGHMPKPFESARLIERVRELIESAVGGIPAVSAASFPARASMPAASAESFTPAGAGYRAPAETHAAGTSPRASAESFAPPGSGYGAPAATRAPGTAPRASAESFAPPGAGYGASAESFSAGLAATGGPAGSWAPPAANRASAESLSPGFGVTGGPAGSFAPPAAAPSSRPFPGTPPAAFRPMAPAHAPGGMPSARPPASVILPPGQRNLTAPAGLRQPSTFGAALQPQGSDASSLQRAPASASAPASPPAAAPKAPPMAPPKAPELDRWGMQVQDQFSSALASSTVETAPRAAAPAPASSPLHSPSPMADDDLLELDDELLVDVEEIELGDEDEFDPIAPAAPPAPLLDQTIPGGTAFPWRADDAVTAGDSREAAGADPIDDYADLALPASELTPVEAILGSPVDARLEASAAEAQARLETTAAGIKAFDFIADIAIEKSFVPTGRTPGPTPGPSAAPAPASMPAAIAHAAAADGGEAMLRAALSAASREVIERIAWEVVPQLAEVILREHVERLVQAREGRGQG